MAHPLQECSNLQTLRDLTAMENGQIIGFLKHEKQGLLVFTLHYCVEFHFRQHF